MEKIKDLGVTMMSAEDLATYMNSRLVSLDVHVGGNTTEFSFPVKQLGMNPGKLSERGKAAYAHNLSAGKLSVLSKEQKNNFLRLEARARNLVKKYEVADGLVLVDDYDEIKSQFESIKTEYLSYASDVAYAWFNLVDTFRMNVADMLEGVRMQKRRRQQIFQEICASIPSKERFESSFYMSMGVKAFNISPNAQGLSGQAALDAAATFDTTVFDTVIAVIEAQIQKAWKAANSALKTYYKSESISGKTMQALDTLADSIVKANIFENPCIARMAENMDLAKKNSSVDDKAWFYGEVVADAYAYGTEHGIELDMTELGMTEEQFENLVTIHKNQIKFA